MKAWMEMLLLYVCIAMGFATLPASADIVTLPVVADTFITSSSPGNNAGGMTWFDAGRDGQGGVRRGLLRFDVSTIPSGSTITSAVLRLTVTRVPSFGAANSTFDLLRLLAAWNEGTNNAFAAGSLALTGDASWNERMHEIASWTAPGARSDVVGTASASTDIAGSGSYDWSDPKMASDVQTWLDNPSMNFGWLLVSEDEISLRTVRG